MKTLHRLLAHLVSLRAITLIAALFLGHLVTVNAVPAMSRCVTAPVASDWRADWQQFDPTYDYRLKLSCSQPAQSTATSDWRAVRQQYDPTYTSRIQTTTVQPAASVIVPDWVADRQQYEPWYVYTEFVPPAAEVIADQSPSQVSYDYHTHSCGDR